MPSIRSVLACVFVAFAGAIVLYAADVRREAPPPSAPGDPPPKVKPMTLKADKSGTVLYFESDGQHVAALDKDGQVLWHKNPAEELKRFKKGDKAMRPVIVYAGPPLDWMLRAMKERGKKEYVAITFSTKAFGLLDKQTGEFTFLGND